MPVDAKQLKDPLVRAGLEIYRSGSSEVQIAERVRSHLMDSGVRLAVLDTGALEVWFTGRTQRSDRPTAAPDELFAVVRSTIGERALEAGFSEAGSAAVEVKDPVDPSRTLDVWYEVRYVKGVPDVDAAVGEIRWVLAVERFITP